MPFEFHADSVLPEVQLIVPRQFSDERGSFSETFKFSEYQAAGIAGPFVQDNESISRSPGTIRGLHFQREPHAQGKLVRAVVGDVFDVAVDIRRDSSTFGKWVGYNLTEKGGEMLWVPAGFAHGFQTLTGGARVAYKCTTEYAPSHEGCIRFDDPAIGIAWPVAEPVLNQRDADAPGLGEVVSRD